MGEMFTDQILARSPGSMQDVKTSAKETGAAVYEKGAYVAQGAYNKASEAKHAALDWFESMTKAKN